ncbi:MAG: hemerythrin domain-containing protein [Gallionella sp.]|nr:hemerythrin domain-containing protein [Gallionella sp.]
MKLKWTKQLSVGNAVIDSEHKNLITIANSVRRAIKARDSAALPQELEHLEDWLYVHFANEEKIAQAVNFDFSQHKLAQQCWLKELWLLRNELIGKNGLWSDDAIEHFSLFLSDWMIDGHIIGLDMPMKPVLQSYGYNFLPGAADKAIHSAMASRNPVPATSGMVGSGCGWSLVWLNSSHF